MVVCGLSSPDYGTSLMDVTADECDRLHIVAQSSGVTGGSQVTGLAVLNSKFTTVYSQTVQTSSTFICLSSLTVHNDDLFPGLPNFSAFSHTSLSGDVLIL